MKILVSDKLAPEGVEILKKEGFQVDVETGLTPEELKKKIKNYDALVIRSATKVTKEIIQAAEKLKVVGRAGVGVDNVNVVEATKKGVMVMNTPMGNTISAAEHALALILALSRNVPQAHCSLKERKWEKKKFLGTEVYGKTLGIIGLGKIGTHLAKIVQGVGMKVIGYDPFLTKDRGENLGVELTTLEDLLKRADYISVHTPLTAQTKHLIGEKQFKLMKDKVKIVNCARGGIIDEGALYKALKEKRIAGAALDVFEKEPPLDSPLLELDNLTVTPHLGASTEEAQYNVAVEVAQQVADALKRGIYRNAINIPTIEPQEWVKIKPYLTLGEKIGSFQAQILEGNIEKVEISYAGKITDFNLPLLTSSLLKGLLDPTFSEDLNYVNAHLLAEERGIKVLEHKSGKAEDFTSLISMDVHTNKKINKVAGALFAKNDPRIVRLNEYLVEVIPSGNILLCYNQDKPGFIGKIGLTLGENNINIEHMTYGQQLSGKEAITALNLNSCPSEEVLEKIKKIKEVRGIKTLTL